jgi:hypothetical protein
MKLKDLTESRDLEQKLVLIAEMFLDLNTSVSSLTSILKTHSHMQDMLIAQNIDLKKRIEVLERVKEQPGT